MRITGSSIAMASHHSLEERDLQSESLRVWGDPKAKDLQLSLENQNKNKQTIIEISAEGKELAAQQQQAVSAAKIEDGLYLSDKDRQKLLLLQKFIEALTGKKIKFNLLTKDQSRIASQSINLGNVQQLQGWGLEYHSYRSHFERETVSFSAAGIVKTADGRQIDISMTLNMTRQFAMEQRIDVKAGDALIDPLIINFDAPAAKLTDTKFSFDLDSDGQADQISFAAAGSGFLALDLNNDGIINNGKELFGPNTGNGFAELAAYDSDNNGWIDENDSIYDKLRIWTKDANGNDQLFALGQKGIGAIYLGNLNTDFAMKDGANNTQGQLRSTGIFLRENGTAGTIQQVDLAI